MAIVTLREHQSTAITAKGMVQIQAFPAPGFSQPVHLSLDGDAIVNTVSKSELRLIRGTGELKLVVTPLVGDEFGPGTSIRVQLTRGRRGTPQEYGAEIVDVTLDGRSETIIGTLTYDGDDLVISAVVGASQGDQPFDGAAASIRAGLRALINRRQIDVSALSQDPTVVSLDGSVSMKQQVSQHDLDLAVDVLSGITGALKPGVSFLVSDDRVDGFLPVGSREELAHYARNTLNSEKNHIGAGARRHPGTSTSPTFSISDEEPYAAEGHGLSLVVGNAVCASRRDPAGTPGVLLITDTLREIIEGDNHAAQEAVFEHLLSSCLEPQPPEGAR